MELALLDTDILSEVMKAKSPIVLARATAYKAAFNQFTLSAISVMEIVEGLQKAKREKALEEFLEGLKPSRVLVFDQACAEMAGRIYGDLERIGQPVGRADPMIAATALQHNLVLVTGNIDHYERIQKLGYPLKLDNWRKV